MTRFILFFTLLAYNCPVLAQMSISGQILDKESGELVGGARIFIAHSQCITASNSDGFFQLENLPAGQLELIVSHLSYEAYTQPLQLFDSIAFELDIQLKKKERTLETVELIGKRSGKWKRRLQRFEKAFLGEGATASKCKILNPEVLILWEEDRDLIAEATDLLEIENQATGYHIWFLLESFRITGKETQMTGKPYFISLNTKEEKQQKRWNKWRKRTFMGSPAHFWYALMFDMIEEEGFEIYHASLTKDRAAFQSMRAAKREEILRSNGPTLVFEHFLKVVYTREKDLISPPTELGGASAQLGRPAEAEMMTQEKNNPTQLQNHQVSFLAASRQQIPFDLKTFMVGSPYVKEYGYWAFSGVSDLLPSDYLPEHLQNISQRKETPKRNGFKLSNLQIPLAEILSGGPPRDGIPSIDQPNFVPVDKATFLNEEDWVLAIEHEGVSKAYPIKILNWHEVVNDSIGGIPLVVTFCPLCGSGIAFRAEKGGKKLTFGVSGLLYNSDVLLYDRETESLWSQIMQMGVSGPHSQDTLESIPMIQTRWGLWKKSHPETWVLSTNTGYDRPYQRKAYSDYLQSEELMFPVHNEDDRLPKKEKVLGISLNGHEKAYPFTMLSQQESPIIDEWAGQKIYIHFDQKAQVAYASLPDGQLLPATTLFWFAWFAFHPDTAVFE